MNVRITRDTIITNNSNLTRFKKNPEHGPKILFFSGGTALRGLSRELIHYSYNSIHIITAFDSGGSSAKLREAFHMPGIGDVRARLMDLADQSLKGNREIYALFAYRFPKQARNTELLQELDKMISGKHRLIAKITDPMRKIICTHLYWFREKMLADFDLRGASIGNLVLTGGYLENRCRLDPVISIFSKLVRVRGKVRPIANKYLHLAAELEDGSLIVGQHLLTGKETKPISSRIKKLFITDDPEKPRSYILKLRKKMTDIICEADLICYPMGSFFSSILAQFLVKGVGEAIAANSVPKIYIPNTGKDPECFGYTVMEQVDMLLGYGRKNDGTRTPSDLINLVLIDRRHGNYQGGIDDDYFKRQGIKLIDCPLINSASKPYIDENLLLPVLLALC
jgi:CofD-related protein of GAK system